MQKQSVVLVLGSLVLLAAGALTIPRFFPQFFADDATLRSQRDEADDVDPARGDEDVGDEDVDASSGERGAERTAVGLANAPYGQRERESVRVQGRVVDASGVPVCDAMVRFGHSPVGPRGDRRHRLPDPVDTDEDGRFAFESRALRVSLQVKHGRYAPGLFDRRVVAASELGAAGDRRSVIDLGDLVLSTGGEILGRVTDLAGNGLAGARVSFEPENRNRWRLARNRDEYLTELETDDNGYYRLAHLPMGAWRAVARAARCTRGLSAAFVARAGLKTQVEDISLGPGFEVAGSVRNQRGEPVANAVVSMRSNGGARRDLLSAATDETGHFLLEHLPGVTMRLEARAEGYLHFVQEGTDAKTTRSIQITMRDRLQIVGTVVEGAGSQPVTTYSVRAKRVRGLDAGGAPGDDRVDQRVPSSGNGRNQARGYPMPRPRTHPDGRFVIGGLQEGIYEVAVQSADHAFHRSREVELRAGIAARDLTLRLDRGVSYSGVVVADDGHPIAGASVELHPSGRIGRRLEAKTNAAGEFAIARVSPGGYLFTAKADGFRRSAEAAIELLGDRSQGRITLRRLGGLTGDVHGLRPRDIAGARVCAVRINSTERAAADKTSFVPGWPVEADGTYSVRDLDPGDYVVRAYLDPTSDALQSLVLRAMSGELQSDVSVQGGETSQLDLEVTARPAGAVTGSVLHNGVPAGGFRVDLTAADGGATSSLANRQVTVGSTGTFKVARVPAGKYVLSVRSAARTKLHEETIEVTADVTVDRDLSVFTTSLKGTVTTADGTDPRDLNGAVWLLAGLAEVPTNYRPGQRSGGIEAITTRLRQGVYEFETVPPGNFLLVVTIQGRQRSTAPVVIGKGSPQHAVVPAGARVGGRGPR